MTEEEIKEYWRTAYCNEKHKREELEESLEKLQKSTFNMIDERNNRITDLEKENADLKCECRTCVYTDSPCVRSDYPSKNGICSHYKNVFEANADLKKEWQEQVQKATDEGYARTLQTMQLTKAKEIIEKLISLNRKEWIYSDVREEAEQFLNEVEK